MADLLLVKNIDREGPGLLTELLAQHNISYDLIEANEPIPSPTGYKAMIVYGGPASANDTDDRIVNELSRVREAIEFNIPYLGVCLGMQVLVKAAGGAVVPGKVKEIGFFTENKPYEVALTGTGRSDPLFTGLADRLRVFQLHGETVELTPDVALLATGETCEMQIVRVGECAYGIQSHFEVTLDMLALWAKHDPDLQPLGEEQLLADLNAFLGDYTNTGKTLFTNFLRIAKVIN